MLVNLRNKIRKSQIGIPPFYPNAWTGVLLSHQLEPNKVKTFIAFGKELIGLRDRLGRIHVIDAFCSHFKYNAFYVVSDGSHDCIKCSINDCSYRLEDCEILPLYNSVNSLCNNDKHRIWQIYECNEIIYVWHHKEGKKPNWYPTKLEDKFSVSTSTKLYSYALVQDVFENSADSSHFEAVHGPLFEIGNITIKNFLAYFFYSKFGHEWSLLKENHKASFSINIKPTILGNIMFELPIPAVSDGHTGFNLKFTMFGKEYLCYIAVVPMHLDRLIMHSVAYSDSTFISKVIAYIICRINDKILQNDFPLWKYKRYYKTPLYTKFDKKIIEFRKWCQQFYSD